MTSLFSKALVYLGLVDEEQYDSERDYDTAEPPMMADAGRSVRQMPAPAMEGRRVEPPASASRTSSARSGPSIAGVRQIRPEAQADILVVEEFGDAKILADRVRDLVPVVLDFRNTEPPLVRRVVDFSSGLIYALEGTMNKVGDGLVLVLPPGTILTDEEKRRLADLGAYEYSVED